MQNPGILQGRQLCNIIWHGKLFSFSFSGRVDFLQYVYFYAQKSMLKAGSIKFQDLINVPRIYLDLFALSEHLCMLMTLITITNF